MPSCEGRKSCRDISNYKDGSGRVEGNFDDWHKFKVKFSFYGLGCQNQH